MPIGPLRHALARRRFEIRMRLGRLPLLYRLVVLNNWSRVRDSHVLVTRRTALVIDGFPSSGNSYAIAALRAAAADAGRPLPEIAHHMHCPRQTVKALRHGVPVVLLIRAPRSCIPSALTRWPSFTPAGTLRAYVQYYESLLPYQDRMVVAPFDTVISAFDSIVDEVRQQSGLALADFHLDRDYAQAVYDPSKEGRAERRHQADAVRAALDDPTLAALVGRAEALYERYSAAARRPGTPTPAPPADQDRVLS